MLSIAEALDAVMREARALAPATSSLEQAQGCVLAEDVLADADSPPFDKALVDGYAVRTTDLEGNEPALVHRRADHRGTDALPALCATREAAVIMTGAPIPPELRRRRDARANADASMESVFIEQTTIKPGQNVLLARGGDARR